MNRLLLLLCGLLAGCGALRVAPTATVSYELVEAGISVSRTDETMAKMLFAIHGQVSPEACLMLVPEMIGVVGDGATATSDHAEDVLQGK